MKTHHGVHTQRSRAETERESGAPCPGSKACFAPSSAAPQNRPRWGRPSARGSKRVVSCAEAPQHIIIRPGWCCCRGKREAPFCAFPESGKASLPPPPRRPSSHHLPCGGAQGGTLWPAPRHPAHVRPSPPFPALFRKPKGRKPDFRGQTWCSGAARGGPATAPGQFHRVGLLPPDHSS